MWFSLNRMSEQRRLWLSRSNIHYRRCLYIQNRHCSYLQYIGPLTWRSMFNEKAEHAHLILLNFFLQFYCTLVTRPFVKPVELSYSFSRKHAMDWQVLKWMIFETKAMNTHKHTHTHTQELKQLKDWSDLSYASFVCDVYLIN